MVKKQTDHHHGQHPNYMNLGTSLKFMVYKAFKKIGLPTTWTILIIGQINPITFQL